MLPQVTPAQSFYAVQIRPSTPSVWEHCCSYREFGFDSRNPHGGLQQPVNPRGLTAIPASMGTACAWCMAMHATPNMQLIKPNTETDK